jgi:hypothetical protein
MWTDWTCCCAGGFWRDALESGGLAVSADGVPRRFPLFYPLQVTSHHMCCCMRDRFSPSHSQDEVNSFPCNFFIVKR